MGFSGQAPKELAASCCRGVREHPPLLQGNNSCAEGLPLTVYLK